jgi:hypothetical protein
MAKIDRRFAVPLAPQQAQSLFIEDVVPQLHRAGGFVLYREAPGHLALSDGITDPMALPGRDEIEYSLLRRLTARRIKVDFVGTPTGAEVTIRGAATRDVRAAIERLGQGGRWSDRAG